MNKPPHRIISQIRALLDELEGVRIFPSSKTQPTKKIEKKITGCIGAIQSLIDDGFFETTKKIVEVVDKLKEEAQPYGKELVSMNLLNLVKRRVLRRIKENKQWHYIIRK